MRKPKATLREQTCESVKELILAGQLRPGERLHERDLTARLGVSRTPVREALTQLTREGLVAHRPQRGFLVESHSAEAVSDLYVLRGVLEGHAIRLALTRAQGSDMANLHRLAQRLAHYDKEKMQSAEELREGQRVHELIARAAHDRFLLDTLMRLYDRLQLFIWIDALYEDDAHLTRREHQDLIEAFTARDRARTIRLADAHLKRSRDNVMRALHARPGLAV